MKAANLNHLWGKLILAELARLGVRQIYLSPGSRSTPLAIAAAESDRIDTTIHFDERGSAFAALGYAKACGRPAALICTSGTALVNYYPAIVEASISLTPLVILSADRPVELRDCGAPQTINQVDIFGDYLRHFVDLSAPSEEFAPEKLLSIVDKLFRRATDAPAGPVQLNCQFREPLAPLGESGEWCDYLAPIKDQLESEQSFGGERETEPLPQDADIKDVARTLSVARRGVIVAGPLRPSEEHRAIVKLAEALSWPLIADISSGLRAGTESQNVIPHADLYLRDAEIADKLKPDLLLHFGAAPSSKAVLNFAASATKDYVQISEHPVAQDPLHATTQRLQANPDRVAQLLLHDAKAAPDDWLTAWQMTEAVASRSLNESLDCATLSEAKAAATLIANAPAGSALFLANSMPIRDVDAFASVRKENLRVGGNRGANGIDGTVASGVGFARGFAALTTILLGDLALLHDLNSLALIRDSKQPVVVLVFNNHGGGIFHFLPIAEVETYFERYFGTPHDYTFKAAAEMFSLPYARPESATEFESAFADLTAAGKSGIIEVRSDRRANAEQHHQLWREVAERVRAELAGPWGE